MSIHLFEAALKKIGLVHISEETLAAINSEQYASFIKAIYIPGGAKVTVDFNTYQPEGPALFFVAPNQRLTIEAASRGYYIFYNQDFYCIQLHDAEVACDGLLFNNIQNMPMTLVPEADAAFITYLFTQLEDEFRLQESSHEEMLRTYLKQLLIKSTRLWKLQHLDGVLRQADDSNLFRKFTQLVDAHYKKKHAVADYADLLFVAPKALATTFKRMRLPQPGEIIKNRIILEAKRLLAHSAMTAKEIAYELGYDDPAYFSRLFQVKVGIAPSAFKAQFLGKTKKPA